MSHQRITDPEVQLLAALARTIEPDFPLGDEWARSPFAWIKQRPSRQVGAIGERLAAGWVASKRFRVGPAPDSQADLLINERRVEVKLSTRWKNGLYKFQQLRDQDYEFAIRLGVCPFDAHCWAIPKAEIIRRWKSGDGIVSQHGGRTGTDTAWLSFKVNEPPAWLAAHGGTLAWAAEVVRRLVEP